MTSPLDGLVNDYLDAHAALEKWKTIADERAAQLIDAIGEGGRHEVKPGVGVRIQRPTRRWSPEHAKLVLLPEQYRMILEPVPSLAKANEVLPAPMVDLCRVPTGRPSVRVI